MRNFLLVVLLLCVAPASAQHGYLEVLVTEVGIEIEVHNITSVVGTTSEPMVFTLLPGTYEVVARKVGYEDLIQTAEVERGEVTMITMNLSRARPLSLQQLEDRAELAAISSGDLQVVSVPANQPVFIDGQERALRTPMEVSGLQPGHYTVKTGDCEVSAPVRENMVVNLVCNNGVVSLTYTSLWSPNAFGDMERGRDPYSNQYRAGEPLEAIPSRGRKGLEAGAGIGSFEALFDGGDTETGLGVYATVAYGATERFAVGLSAAVGVIDDEDADDGHAVTSVGALFGRLYFGTPGNATRPYVAFGGGGGKYTANLSGESVSATGLAAMIGFGVDHTTTGSLGFFLELNYNAISFDNITFADPDADEISIDLHYVIFSSGLRFRF